MILTASYATADPDRGVPVQTSIGAPRFVGYPLVKWETVMPWGLLDITDPEEFRRRYRHRLHSKTPKVLAELAELQEAYAPLPLLLCCFEPAGTFCHRTLLAEWLQEHLDEMIPELT